MLLLYWESRVGHCAQYSVLGGSKVMAAPYTHGGVQMWARSQGKASFPVSTDVLSELVLSDDLLLFLSAVISV